MPTNSNDQAALSAALAASNQPIGAANPQQFSTNLQAAAARAASSTATSRNPNSVIGASSSGQMLQYPSDIGKYYMVLLISDFIRPTVDSSIQPTSQVSIALPLPSEMVDAQNIEYTPQQRAAAVGMASDKIAEMAQGSAAFAKNPAAAAAAAQGLMGRAAQAVGDIAGGLGTDVAAALGLAANPFLTVQLTAPEFKLHQFSWMFSPNTEDESRTLKFIINTLKKRSLAALNKNTSGVFLNYPNMVKPHFVPNENELYAFKWSVIPSITVNWSAGTGPSFYSRTQAPGTVQLILNLMEIELWLQDDPFFNGKSY